MMGFQIFVITGIFIAMLVTGMLLLFANMSIEPIITVYVIQLMDDQTKVTLISGVACHTR